MILLVIIYYIRNRMAQKTFNTPVATWFIVYLSQHSRRTFWSINLNTLLSCSSCWTDNDVFKLLMYNVSLQKDTEQPEINAVFSCLLQGVQMKGMSGRNTEGSFRTIRVSDLGLFGLVWGKKVSAAVVCVEGIPWFGSVQIRVSIWS